MAQDKPLLFHAEIAIVGATWLAGDKTWETLGAVMAQALYTPYAKIKP